MGRTSMKSEVDFGDVQGIVRFGYGKLKGASYALARIKNLEAARSWLLSAPVATAIERDPPPATALQVAFTVEGLRALLVPDAVIGAFSHEFVSGMTQESRSRRLGDLEANSPSNWAWGNGDKVPHLLAMFFAQPDCLDAFKESSTGAIWNDAFEVTWLYTADLDGIEPFGFVDGISQPKVDWEQQRNMLEGQIDYGNVVALGEFLLGYRNEYGKYTDRPLVDGNAATADLLDAEDAPEKKDVGRNGTYLVMRDLQQDVRRFWQFLHKHARGDLAFTERLATAMVGRTRDGDPLVPTRREPTPGIGRDADEVRQNRFTFESDPEGVACPFGAHVRRANPRNTDYPGRPVTLLSKIVTMLGFGPKGFRDDLISSVRYHRILRRGREYGSGLSPQDALEPAPPDDPSRGLHFVCLNGNILRQFEFLQNAWIANTKFDAMSGESDPLLGNRQPIWGCPVTSDFNIPKGDGLRQRVSGLEQFVTVRGGAYFFLPSLRVLRYFAAVGAPTTKS
jgi:deferrochelatase/peroxidase EfeB